MHGLFKKFIIALPFFLAILIFMQITFFMIILHMIILLAVFIWLLLKTPHWWLQIGTIVIPAMSSIIAVKYKLIQIFNPNWEGADPVLRQAFIIACIMSIVNILILYRLKLKHVKEFDLKPILVRSAKFSGAIGIVFLVFLASITFAESQEEHFAVQLSAFFLVPVCFLVVCHVLDLFHIERKTANRRSELRKELEDVYLEERKKLETQR